MPSHLTEAVYRALDDGGQARALEFWSTLEEKRRDSYREFVDGPYWGRGGERRVCDWAAKRLSAGKGAPGEHGRLVTVILVVTGPFTGVYTGPSWLRKRLEKEDESGRPV
jgi:hypothetical protein